MNLEAIRNALRKKRQHPTIKTQRDWTDGKGVITTALDNGTVTRERDVERDSRLEADLTPAPLIDVPDKYKQRRPCTCKNHVGNKWRPLSEFSERKAKNGKRYPSSWCRVCVAAYVQEQRQNGLYKLNKQIP